MSTPIANPVSADPAAKARSAASEIRTPRAPLPDDGTRQLLQWGGSMVATGLLCALLLITVLGGYSRLGASTNAGWFALIVALITGYTQATTQAPPWPS